MYAQVNKLIKTSMLAACASIATSSAFAANLSMADLQALVTQKGYAEILSRATEIAPSSRDSNWQKIVLDAALAQGKSVKADEFSYFDADIHARYPQISTAAGYQSFAQPRAIEAGKACIGTAYSDVSYCIDALSKFADRYPSADFAYQAADVIAGGSNAQNAALMLRKSLSADNKKHCSSPRTADIAMAALSTPSGATATAASEIADLCFTQLSPSILKAMATESVGGYTLQNACGLMQKKSALKGLIAQKCTATLKR